jgi:hypothetical protein
MKRLLQGYQELRIKIKYYKLHNPSLKPIAARWAAPA